jgi:hypothetical protein
MSIVYKDGWWYDRDGNSLDKGVVAFRLGLLSDDQLNRALGGEVVDITSPSPAD